MKRISNSINPSFNTTILICPQGVGQSVMECDVKALCDVKVIGSKTTGTKHPVMLRVGVAQARRPTYKIRIG
jgi:hypothetical protein